MNEDLDQQVNTEGSNNNVIVIVSPQAGIQKPAPVPAVRSSSAFKPAALHKVMPVKTPVCDTAPVSTLVGSVLDRIPDAGGIDISDSTSHFRGKIGFFEKLTAGTPVSLSPIRDGFADGLIRLGVHPNAARLFVEDGKFSDHEAIESMAAIGNSTFATRAPGKTTLDALAPVYASIEKAEGIKLTDDTKQGLARFEDGMRDLLDEKFKNPEAGLETLFKGAVDPVTLGVKGVVDFVAEGAKVTAAPVILPTAPGIH